MNNLLPIASVALLDKESNIISIEHCLNKLKIGHNHLVSTIKDLPQEAFTWHPILATQSIGAQILHIAYTEAFWFGDSLPEDAKKYLWDDDKIESNLSIPTKSAKWYLDLLGTVRYSTTEKMKQFSSDGYISLRSKERELEKFPASWALWQLIEHEAHHKGQISLLKDWYEKAHTPIYA